MKMQIQRRTKRNPRRKGAALVEAAFVLPIVILLILGLLEYGRYFLMVHVSNNAVAAGAAYACKHTSPIIIGGTTYGNADADVQNVVNANLGAQQLAGPTIAVYRSDSLGNNLGSWTTAGAGQFVCVQLTGTYTFVTTGLLGLPSTSPQTFRVVRQSEGN